MIKKCVQKIQDQILGQKNVDQKNRVIFLVTFSKKLNHKLTKKSYIKIWSKFLDQKISKLDQKKSWQKKVGPKFDQNLFLGILYRDPSRGASIYNLSPRRIGPILSPTLGKSAWLWSQWHFFGHSEGFRSKNHWKSNGFLMVLTMP